VMGGPHHQFYGGPAMQQQQQHQNNHGWNGNQGMDMFRAHDSISYISQDHRSGQGMVPVGMFMNMNNVPPRYFQQQQQSAIQQAAKQSRNRKLPMSGPGGGSSQGGPNRNSQQYRGRSSQPGPLTQGGMSQMMSQPGFSLSQQPDFSQDFGGGDFVGGQSQGDGLLSQDFTNSQGPDKFYSNFHSQSGNNF